jgi:hypothetical protein
LYATFAHQKTTSGYDVRAHGMKICLPSPGKKMQRTPNGTLDKHPKADYGRFKAAPRGRSTLFSCE